MALKMNLWKVAGLDVQEVHQAMLDKEDRLEQWIWNKPAMLGIEVLLIGKEVHTEYRGRIDLLGIDWRGDLVIFELKRGRTPREVVAQVLDYATWVKELSYEEIDSIAIENLGSDLASAFGEYFGDPLPDVINTSHRMVIIASELDDSSERIVQYLAEDHGVDINAIFFTYFKAGSEEHVGRAWLMDPEEVQDRAKSRKQAPWSGYWYVNVTEGEYRSWDDNARYGFISAGTRPAYSEPFKKMEVGDKFFAYIRAVGYVGFGEVTRKAVMIRDFVVDAENKRLLDLELKAPKAAEYSDDPERSEWAVGVRWIKTFPKEEAKTFEGIFTYRSMRCKLYANQRRTIDFLMKEFGVDE